MVFQRMRERHYRGILDEPPRCTLAELRKSCDRSQVTVAEALGIRQIAISRLERRGDTRLSTLGSYVAALGGELQIIVRFPRRAVRLVWTEPG